MICLKNLFAITTCACIGQFCFCMSQYLLWCYRLQLRYGTITNRRCIWANNTDSGLSKKYVFFFFFLMNLPCMLCMPHTILFIKCNRWRILFAGLFALRIPYTVSYAKELGTEKWFVFASNFCFHFGSRFFFFYSFLLFTADELNYSIVKIARGLLFQLIHVPFKYLFFSVELIDIDRYTLAV